MESFDLHGLIDLHVHTAPDIRPRVFDDLDAVRAAAQAGMRAVLIKSHWTLTADRATIAEKAVGGISVRGGLALNSTVGWLNPRAVEVALAMGAAQIWMPTLDLATGRARRREPMLYDSEGRIRSEIHEILDLVRGADAILGTGHLPVAETVALVRLARERGLRKVLITHPEASFIGMDVATQQELCGQGVYYERCYNDATPLGGEPGVSLEEIARQIRAVGVESTVLSTDYGQVGHAAPTEGLRSYLAGLAQCGFSAAELCHMAGENPAYLLGL
jgi:hypothetical protein